MKHRSTEFMLKIFSAAALICGLLAAPAMTAAQKPYHIVDHWKIGGDGGWDYLLADPPAHRLYITHGPRVEVLDTATGKPVGALTGFKGTHGIAVNPDGKVGYISDGGANAVVVFDRATLATLATITVGTNPDGITFEPATKTVWAFNGRSKNVSVIDVATQKVVATIALPGKPEFPQVDGTGNVYDNIEDTSSIVHLDAKTLKLVGTWPAGCESPSGMAFDVAGHRLFPVCDGNKMGVVDSLTGKLIATPTIGAGPDAAGFDAKDQLAFASSGDDGILSVVDTKAAGYPTIEKLPTLKGGRTMAYDSGSDRIYVVVAEYGPKPAPTAEVPKPRAPVLPGSFQVIVIGR